MAQAKPISASQIDLDYTQILSPIDGVVIDRKIQPGQTVAAAYQTPLLFQIARDLSQILIYAQVDEADIGAVHSGVRRNSPSTPIRTRPSTVWSSRSGSRPKARRRPPIDGDADAAGYGPITYTVVVTAQNPGKRLFPDMTATVRIVSGQRDNVRPCRTKR